jgi:hypothetical protein
MIASGSFLSATVTSARRSAAIRPSRQLRKPALSEPAFDTERPGEMWEFATQLHMAPQMDFMHHTRGPAALVAFGFGCRLEENVGCYHFFGVMDGRAAFEADAEEQHTRPRGSSP